MKEIKYTLTSRGAFLTEIDTKNSTAMFGIGYREVLWYFKGLVTKSEATELIKRNTRRLAKRQLTWFGKNKNIIWIGAEDANSVVNTLSERWRK